MFGLTNLMNALTRLANALNGLATTAEQVNAATRERLQLDNEPQRLTIYQQPEEASNGRKRKS